MLVHFCSGEHWQFRQWITPSFCWIIDWTRGFVTLQLWCILAWFTSISLLFSLRIQPIWIRIHNIFISSCFNVLLNSKKEENYQEHVMWKTVDRRREGMLTKECTVKYSNISHLFTSSALVLRPFPGSPLHRSQNLSSSFFNSLGFRPDNEAPGTSSSVKTATFVEVVDMSAMFACFLEAFLASLWC